MQSKLRLKLPTVWDIYNFLTNTRDLYLPKWKNPHSRPKVISEKYLLSVMFGQAFSIKRDQIRTPKVVQSDITSAELLKILEEIADKPLNFEKGRPPHVKWLKKVIYSIKPDHPIFTSVKEKINKMITPE